MNRLFFFLSFQTRMPEKQSQKGKCYCKITHIKNILTRKEEIDKHRSMRTIHPLSQFVTMWATGPHQPAEAKRGLQNRFLYLKEELQLLPLMKELGH